MSYKYTKGSQVIGDLKAEDDTERNTLIDFGEDRIDLQTSGSTRFKISGSNGAITFNEAFTFPTSDGTANQILETNGSGQLSWVDNSGGGGELAATSDSKVLIAHLGSTFNVTTTSTNERLTVPFNSVLKNSFAASDFNTSTYTFTAPEEGYYFINCSLYHESINTSVSQYQVRISSSAGWGNNGSIALRNYFPAGAAENSIHVHRLDRIAHLSGSDEVKIVIRPIYTAGSHGTLNSLPQLSYLTIQKLEYVKREEIVVTGSTSTALDSTYNGGTVIITPLSADVTYTLPNPEPDFKVKFLAGTNLVGGDVIFKTKQSSQKIFGLLHRISFGGDSDTGYDLTPQSYNGAGEAQFAGGGSEQHRNTITVENALQGSDIDFYSDGVYWYVRGSVVAAASTGAAAVITFSSGSY